MIALPDIARVAADRPQQVTPVGVKALARGYLELREAVEEARRANAVHRDPSAPWDCDECKRIHDRISALLGRGEGG